MSDDHRGDGRGNQDIDEGTAKLIKQDEPGPATLRDLQGVAPVECTASDHLVLGQAECHVGAQSRYDIYTRYGMRCLHGQPAVHRQTGFAHRVSRTEQST